MDTPGAACGIGAEERGQGRAIAENLSEMSGLKVPVLSIVIGEGGSGGALALAVANEVWMMENATYSILSPEGFASILWKDGKRAKEAAGIMKITAKDLKRTWCDRVDRSGSRAGTEEKSGNDCRKHERTYALFPGKTGRKKRRSACHRTLRAFSQVLDV